MVLSSKGNVGILESRPDVSAILEINSTTQGFLPPSMTTAQCNGISSPEWALAIFNTDSNCMQYYPEVDWYSFGCQ